jgi:two-component system, sensor histidine kinase and response regulator
MLSVSAIHTAGSLADAAVDETISEQREDYRAYPVLYVDDEPQNLLAFRYAMEGRFSVLTATQGSQAVQILERENVAVLICDQRMPEMTGIEVCRRAREIKPDVVRIIVTAYADLQAATDAINQGQVLRYLNKPWRNDELAEVLGSAVELVRMRRLVQAMQARLLRGGHPPILEAMSKQIATELRDQVTSLEMNAEQVSDLLSAGLSTWDSSHRAKELVEHARETHRESTPPITHLRSIVHKLERGQRLPEPASSHSSDVVRVVRATARILSSTIEPTARLQLVISGSPVVQMDAASLGQVLMHLIVNAEQALKLQPDQAGNTIVVQVAETATGAEIAVCDSGPGIRADQLERIFDPYFTTREGAAGLGLSFARHLVTLAGGSISVESRCGAGARFLVRLPHS